MRGPLKVLSSPHNSQPPLASDWVSVWDTYDYNQTTNRLSIHIHPSIHKCIKTAQSTFPKEAHILTQWIFGPRPFTQRSMHRPSSNPHTPTHHTAHHTARRSAGLSRRAAKVREMMARSRTKSSGGRHRPEGSGTTTRGKESSARLLISPLKSGARIARITLALLHQDDPD